MRRYQLFEFLDQPWLPDRIRKAATAYLKAAYATTPLPARWAALLARVLQECGIDRIVDIGSGAGGPTELVMKHLATLGRRPRLTLTDLYPVRTASANHFEPDYWPEPVDAACVPRQLPGVRTLFLSFHHFAPPVARAVLRDAFAQRQAICIFEATSRTPRAVALSFLIPVLVFFVTPSIRPVSMFQIFFTYLVPLIPLLAFWDGLVSQLRTYSMPELRELSAGLLSEEYGWEYGFIEAPRLPFRTCYLIGRPKTERPRQPSR